MSSYRLELTFTTYPYFEQNTSLPAETQLDRNRDAMVDAISMLAFPSEVGNVRRSPILTCHGVKVTDSTERCCHNGLLAFDFDNLG